MKIYIVTVIIEVSWPNALPDLDDVHYASSLEKCMEFLVKAHLDGEFELDDEIQISTDAITINLTAKNAMIYTTNDAEVSVFINSPYVSFTIQSSNISIVHNTVGRWSLNTIIGVPFYVYNGDNLGLALVNYKFIARAAPALGPLDIGVYDIIMYGTISGVPVPNSTCRLLLNNNTSSNSWADFVGVGSASFIFSPINGEQYYFKARYDHELAPLANTTLTFEDYKISITQI